MQLSTITILILAFVALGSAQRTKTIASANRSIDDVVPEYQVVAQRSWFGKGGIAEFIDLLSVVNGYAALNVSNLFEPSYSPVVLAQIVLPNSLTCLQNSTFETGAVSAALFYENETALEQYLCCQVSIFNAPGVNLFMKNIESLFFGSGMWSSFQDDVIVLLNNIAQLRGLASKSLVTGACKDDKRIHVYETQITRAENIAKVMGLVLKTYEYVQARALTMLGCFNVTEPVTTCLQNTTIGSNQIPLPDYLFLPFDSVYQGVCGYNALAAFESFRTTPISCSSKRK